MIRKAWWLAIYSFNFVYFVKAAALASPVFGLHGRWAAAMWALIAALTGQMLRREIRKAING